MPWAQPLSPGWLCVALELFHGPPWGRGGEADASGPEAEAGVQSLHLIQLRL